MNAYLCACTYEQWAHVEGCSALIGRNEALVEAHHLLYHFDELLGGKFGHEDSAAGALQAGCILVGTEHTYLAVGTAICLESLEGFLTVVKACGCHVQGDSLLAAHLYFAPRTVAVVATHVVISLHVTE